MIREKSGLTQRIQTDKRKVNFSGIISNSPKVEVEAGKINP